MPKVQAEEIPERIRPYVFHRLDLDWGRSREPSEAKGDCPFCGGVDKFRVEVATGQYRCFVCGGPSKNGGGNIYHFLRQLHRVSLEGTNPADLELLAQERKVAPATIEAWGWVQSHIDRQWLFPGYGGKGEINNLYRWDEVRGKHRLKGTTGMAHCLFGWQFWDHAKSDVFVAEGPGDTMKLWEALQTHKIIGGEIAEAEGDESIYAEANVVGVPGCETFKEEWLPAFNNKMVYLCYDSDHPKRWPAGHKQAGEVKVVKGRQDMPGYNGMEFAVKRLAKVAADIRIINWGEGGFHPDLPDGFDIRDGLTTDLVLKVQ